MIKKFTHSSRKKEKIYLYIFPAKLIFFISVVMDGYEIWERWKQNLDIFFIFNTFTSVGSWVKTVYFVDLEF